MNNNTRGHLVREAATCLVRVRNPLPLGRESVNLLLSGQRATSRSCDQPPDTIV